MSTANQSNPDGLELSRPRVNPWTIWGIIIVIALGLMVGYNYVIGKIREEHAKVVQGDSRPPMLGRLETDLTAVESSGSTVQLSELKGKVMLVSYVFTRCPRGCAGVVAIKKLLQEKFGNHPKFHLVSISVDAGYDTPETLTEFAKTHQVSGDNWWFLTGEKKDTEEEQLAERNRICQYLTNPKGVNFHPVREVPEKDRLNESDLYIHDARIAVIDHMGRVRGLHEVLHPQLSDVIYKKLVRDIEKVLKEADEAGELPR
jgi:protein SCO1/2